MTVKRQKVRRTEPSLDKKADNAHPSIPSPANRSPRIRGQCTPASITQIACVYLYLIRPSALPLTVNSHCALLPSILLAAWHTDSTHPLGRRRAQECGLCRGFGRYSSTDGLQWQLVCSGAER